jgi:hypothetical protein
MGFGLFGKNVLRFVPAGRDLLAPVGGGKYFFGSAIQDGRGHSR